MPRFGNLNPYEIHKHLINDYVLKKSGDTRHLFQRDTSRDRTDLDVLRENHKFLWHDESGAESWEQQLAKKYYDKLFKEYCICDLSRYKENRVSNIIHCTYYFFLKRIYTTKLILYKNIMFLGCTTMAD